MGSCVPTLPRFLDRHGEPPSSPALWPPCVEDERGSSRHTARTLRASSAGLLRVSSVNQEPFPDLPLQAAPSVLRFHLPPWSSRLGSFTVTTAFESRVFATPDPSEGTPSSTRGGRTEGFPRSPWRPHAVMPASLMPTPFATLGFPADTPGRPSVSALVVCSLSLGPDGLR